MAGKRGIEITISADPASTKAALEAVRAQMRETAGEAARDGSIIENAFERATRALEYVGIHAGIRETVEGLKDLVGGSLELGEALTQASQKTGLSVESMSVLHYATGILGTDFNRLVTAVGRMDRQIGEAADGSKQAAALMQSLGLNAKELSGRADGAEIAFHKFVNTIASTENPVRRAQLAQELLGRAGAEQIPVLIEVAQHWDEFAQRAQAAGVMLTTETAAQMAAVSQEMADLKEHVHGAGLELTEGLAPALDRIAKAFNTGTAEEQGFSETGSALGTILKTLITICDGVALAVRAVADVFSGEALSMVDSAEAIGEAITGHWQKAREAMNKAEVDERAGYSVILDDARHFREQYDALWGDKAGPKALPAPKMGPAFKGTGEYATSSNQVASAAAALAEEQAKAIAAVRKTADEEQLAELEAQHKMLLVSDQEFYAEKLRLQMDELDAEEAALKQKQTALQTLLKKQQGDGLLKRDGGGQSAAELRTKRELLQLDEQINALQARRAQSSSANAADADLANKAAELGNLRAAAELEKQRSDGITAQIALLEKETQLEAQKAAYQGESAAAVAAIRANGQILEQKLRIAEVDRQIEQTEAEFNAKAKEIEEAAAKGQISKLAAERQLNALHKQEAAVLQSLIQQYDALAQTLGGDFATKAEELHAALQELQMPDKSKEPQYGKVMAAGITRMADTIVAQSIRGKEAFHQMAKQMEVEAAELAIKLMELKFLKGGSGGGVGGGGGGGGGTGGFGGILSGLFTKLFSGMGGGGGDLNDFGADGPGVPGFAAGGTMPGGVALVGENGPELVQAPRGSTVTPNDVLAKMTQGGGGSRSPNITTNVINQSSQPVTAQPSQVSYDEQMRTFVISTVLSDHAQGGPIAQAMRGLASS